MRFVKLAILTAPVPMIPTFMSLISIYEQFDSGARRVGIRGLSRKVNPRQRRFPYRLPVCGELLILGKAVIRHLHAAGETTKGMRGDPVENAMREIVKLVVKNWPTRESCWRW